VGVGVGVGVGVKIRNWRVGGAANGRDDRNRNQGVRNG
jgi:hypothetical protein